MDSQYLVGLLASFSITFFLIPYFCVLAYRFGIVDKPDNRIKLHEKVTPYLGGVALYLGFIITVLFLVPINVAMLGLITGCSVLLLVGLIDDILVLAPYQKFLGQGIASFCFLAGGLYLRDGLFPQLNWGMGLSVFWFLLVPNAINLVDIMDGLASIIALGATFNFAIMAFLFHKPEVAVAIFSFMGPLLAFAWYNRPPARIYLGDAGSLFIGGFLSAIPFLIPWGDQHPWGFLVPVVILAIPLTEVASLIGIRTYKGIPFYRGSRDHFAHYLLDGGWGKYKILGYCLLISSFLLLISLFFLLFGISPFIFLFINLSAVILWFSILVRIYRARFPS